MTFLRHKARRKLRLALAGYRQLEKAGRSGLLRELKNALARSPQPVSDFSGAVLGFSCGEVATVVHQYLLQRLIGRAFDHAILRSVADGEKVSFPLPKTWRDVISNAGLPVDHNGCALRWIGFLVLEFGRGIARGIRASYPRPCNAVADIRASGKTVAFFVDLNLSNIVPSVAGRERYSLPQWFAGSVLPSMPFDVFAHDADVPNFDDASGVVVKQVSKPFASLPPSPRAYFLYLISALRIVVAALAALLVGKWWPSLLLGEALVASTVRVNSTQQNPNAYFFHFSSAIYRPLWTYEAERLGSQILCYFYTTYEQPSINNRVVPQEFEFANCTWPHYLVWDARQKERLASLLRKPTNSSVTGPCWFVDSPSELPSLPASSVAVFPVEAHRRTVHLGSSTLVEYFSQAPNLSALFLEDVVSALASGGFHPALKGKRDLGSALTKRYSRLRASLAESGAITLIESSISPVRLIARSQAVISLPFTATALLAPKGMPSIYYDPIGWIAKDDPAAHGIPILSGREELQTWLSKLAAPAIA